MPTGFLFVGHGTRNSAGCSEFLQLHQQVRQRMEPLPVEPAFLELAEPTIAAAIENLWQAGVTEVICAPVILLAAAHVKQDIPRAVRSAAERVGIPSVRFVEHLGCREAALELSLLRYDQALERQGDKGSVGWVLVGRGTRDAQALAEIRQFQTLREAKRPSARNWLGFLAMAEPSLAETLRQAAEAEVGTIVVQPHLLFQGELLARIDSLTRDFAHQFTAKKWLLAEHLGPDSLLADAIAADLLAAIDRQIP